MINRMVYFSLSERIYKEKQRMEKHTLPNAFIYNK